MDINVVTMVGRLTKDAELKFTADGKGIASFSLAINGYKKDEAYFFFCKKWNAEKLAVHLTKGKQVAITGELRQERWEKDGQRQSMIVINVQTLQFVGSAGGQEKQKSAEQAEQNGFADDVPF